MIAVHRASVVAALAICSAPVAAQANPQDTLHATEIEPVVVRVARGRSSVNRAPFALTITTPDSTRPGQRHSAVDETLALIPGLSVNSRSNPSQDPRLSIRGFGARSAFGVRGIRVLRDGIPLTLPDGQTPLDYMSLESVGHVEVMRGSASALYGNASGGVIDLKSSAPASAKIAADVRQWLGAFGFNRTVVAASGTTNRLYYQGDVSRTTSEGAREHARQRATSLFLRSGFIAGSTEYSASLLGFDMPQAENPGALTLAQMRADPRAADQPSVIKNARKAAKQVQAALSANRTLSNGTLSGSVFAGARSLDNPLTFGIVEIGRHSQGASGRASLRVPVMSALNHLSVGVDLQSQNDLRRNYANCNESPSLSAPTASCPTILEERGIVTLDQRELVSSAGVYASNEVALGSRLNLTAGVRADQVRFEVEDRMISSGNPDDSGERTMKSVTPIVGLLGQINERHSVYANVSSAFETPTATELGNQPDGSAGLNRDLKPQRSTSLEVGIKGMARMKLRYDVAVYSTRVRDELVPFEIAGSNGRRYFRNAGRTNRAGGEVGIDASAGIMNITSSYSYSRFRFDEYTSAAVDYSGKYIPGVPRHRFQAATSARWSRGFALVEAEAAGSAFVNDANTVVAPGYEVAHVRGGVTLFERLPFAHFTIGIQNVFDRVYAPSLVVNAARDKYFEPAPRRTLYAGLSIGARSN